MITFSRYLIVIGAFLAAATMMAENPQSPSQFGKTDRENVPLVTFVLVESRDFRLLYCGYDVLKSRIERKVCVVDTLAGGPREVAVNKGDTVRSILGKIGKEKSTAQIRLIGMDAIDQTPLAARDPERAKLLDRQIQPGDIIVIAAQT